MSIGKLQNFLEELVLGETQMLIGGQILKEIRARIKFLMDVGLDYLTLAALPEHFQAVRRREYVWQRRSDRVLWE